MRANALTIIHKVIRRELFDVSALISSAGPEDVDAVRASIAAVTGFLNAHAAHEEAGFEPKLRERNPELAACMLDDHHRLHTELDAAGDAARRLDPASPEACTAALLQLHLDWNRFVGGYLLHIDDEERRLFADLEDIIPPVTFMAEAAVSSGEEGKAFLEKLWKVTAPDEREAIEGALKQR